MLPRFAIALAVRIGQKQPSKRQRLYLSITHDMPAILWVLASGRDAWCNAHDLSEGSQINVVKPRCVEQGLFVF